MGRLFDAVMVADVVARVAGSVRLAGLTGGVFQNVRLVRRWLRNVSLLRAIDGEG